MDSAGSGYYPISRSDSSGFVSYYTELDNHVHSVDIQSYDSSQVGIHAHTVDIPPFSSSSGGQHNHDIDFPITASSTASTSDVMPYIQFLVCEKD